MRHREIALIACPKTEEAAFLIRLQDDIVQRIDQGILIGFGFPQSALGSQQLLGRGAKLSPHSDQIPGCFIQLGDRIFGGLLIILPRSDFAYHFVHGVQRLGDSKTHFPGTLIQHNKEDRIEQNEARHHEQANMEQLGAHRIHSGINAVLRNDEKKLPTGFTDGVPRDDLLIPVQRKLGYAFGARRQKLRQLRKSFPMIQIKLFRFEGVLENCLAVAVAGQFIQPPVLFSFAGQGEDHSVLPKEKTVAVPWDIHVQHLFRDGAHGHIDAHDTLQKITVINRRNAGSHPAVSRRVQIDVRPLNGPLWIVLGIRLIVKIKGGNIRKRCIL